MHVRMLCLGRHWNGQTYASEAERSDVDGRPAPPLPDDLRGLAESVACAAGMPFTPDLCILNYYPVDGRMGVHQDKDEVRHRLRPETRLSDLNRRHGPLPVSGG